MPAKKKLTPTTTYTFITSGRVRPGDEPPLPVYGVEEGGPAGARFVLGVGREEADAANQAAVRPGLIVPEECKK